MSQSRLMLRLLAAVGLAAALPVQAAEFDGTYRGPRYGTPGGSGCRIKYGGALRVKDGVATMPTVSSGQLTGTVAPDGSMALHGTGGSTSVTGKITGTQFAGTMLAGRCTYVLAYTRS